MKKICFTLFCSLNAYVSFSQLSITPNQTALQLANKLVATSGTLGVGISNATLNCDTNANAEFTGVSNLGIADGIALGSGDIQSNALSSTFGIDGLPGDMASTWLNGIGDPTLDAIVSPNVTHDACVLEFDLQPVGNFVEFEYVFGSEEYPEFNCSPFNDIFGFFISGPGLVASTNIALIPSTTTEVSINTINDGSVSGIGCPVNTSLYINNTGTTSTIDGFTSPLIAHVAVTPSATYHLKLAIADVSDGVLNSYVLLKANSLKSGGSTPSSIETASAHEGITVYPTIVNSSFHILNVQETEWQIELISLGGQLVYANKLGSSEKSLDVRTDLLSKGMYLLKMRRVSDDKLIVQKIIKE